MATHKRVQVMGIVGMLFLSFLLVPPSFADSPIFPPPDGDQEVPWKVLCATDSGSNPRDIRVFVQGEFVGKCSELKIQYEMAPNDYRQIFSVKGRNAALRPALPDGEWGGTFYPTGYWRTQDILEQNMQIVRLDIRLDPRNNRLLRLRGKAVNGSSFKTTNFTLQFYPPTAKLVKVKVAYTLFALEDFTVSELRQEEHQGFRIARIASNYESAGTHDSDQARYIDEQDRAVCFSLQNRDGFFWPDPLPMGKPTMWLIHSDSLPRNTPTLSIAYRKPRRGQITPQGWMTHSEDPDDDNVDFWGNWDHAKLSYEKGEKIGRFVYILNAKSPRPMTCDIIY